MMVVFYLEHLGPRRLVLQDRARLDLVEAGRQVVLVDHVDDQLGLGLQVGCVPDQQRQAVGGDLMVIITVIMVIIMLIMVIIIMVIITVS